MQILLFWFAVLVVGQVLYHSTLKSVDTKYSPLLVIGVAYGTGLVLLSVVAAFTGELRVESFSGFPWCSAVLVGVAVSFVEVGYLMAYRHGLPISLGPLMALAATTLALVPIGLAIYHEPLDWRSILGLTLLVSGLALLASKHLGH